MRSSFAVWVLFSQMGSAQSTWTWIGSTPGHQYIATDVIGLASGNAISSIAYEGLLGGLPCASRLIEIDEFGSPMQSIAFPTSWMNVQANFILGNTLTTEVIVGGSVDFAAEKGVFALALDSDLSVAWERLILRDGLQYTQALNGLVSADGSFWIGGSGQVPPGSYNRVLLVKLDASGQVVADTIYGTTPNLSFVRQLAHWNDQVWMAVEGGGPDEFVGSGGIRAFRLNPDLTVSQWFTMAYIDQDPEPPYDSIPRGTLDLVPISSSRYITSGHFGPIAPPLRRAAVLVSDSMGTIHRLFLPRSTYPMDQPPFLQALSLAPDGNLYFAMHENAQLGPPSPFSVFEPNRIHVYKLDTSLNVLCEHILDGFVDNAYYYLNRIKATDDGGFLLLGGRRDFSDPSGYFAAWAQKFGPDDCVVGVSEQPSAQQAVAFPNPGAEGFTVLLNGEARDGTLLVLDALARTVGTAPIKQSQARFDARHLAPGAYLYRALDAKGALQAVGRWVKE